MFGQLTRKAARIVPSNTSPSTNHLLSILEEKATRLSAASDQLNAAFETIQQRLSGSGIGLEAWITIDTTRIWSDEAEQLGMRIWDEDQLGYGRFGDSWALLTRTAHFEESADQDERWDYGDVKPLVRSTRRVRIEAVRALPALLSELHKEADRVLDLVADAERFAYLRPAPGECLWCYVEATSSRRLAISGPRECPVCVHVFQGKGWDGIDAHWKANHAQALDISYDEFWRGIMGCVRHWEIGTLSSTIP